MKILKYIISGIAALVLASSTFAASLVLDDFNTPLNGQTIVLYPPGGSAATGPISSFVVGGSRNIIVGTLDTPFSGVVAAGRETGAGVNFFSDGVGSLENSIVSQTAVRFEYNRFGAGLNHVVAPNDWFTLHYAVDQLTFFRITLSSGLGGPVVSSIWTSPLIGFGFGIVVSPTAAIAFPGVNLADVDQIWLTIVPIVNGGDVYVDNFTQVPEPSTYAGLFALGLTGFVAYRRLCKV